MNRLLSKIYENLPYEYVPLLIYATLILGLWLFFSNDIIRSIDSIYNETRFRMQTKSENENRSAIFNHLRMLLKTTGNWSKPSHTYYFMGMTIVIYILVLGMTWEQSSLLFRFMTPLLIASFPYGVLLLRLRMIRVKGSYEGEALVSELLNQYKINYYNMSESIDRAVKYLDKSPHTGKLLLKLSLQLKEYRNDEELQRILTEFTFGVDTEWIRMLSNNIYNAISDGTNVCIGLEDILKELRESKAVLEENKRINQESYSIVSVFVPLGYLATVGLAVKYFDFTITKFLNYQFLTATGIKFFLMIVILSIASFVLLNVFTKQKFDF